MSTKRSTLFVYGRNKQRGSALMVMLMILIIGIAAILLNSLSSTTLKSARRENTATTLAQVKDALIGYAVTYGDTHSGQALGYLPCPDIDGNSSGNSEGSSELTCGLKNVSSIGKLPWRTLNLPALNDGECLWYAVSGTYKNSPKTDFMNWDNNGLFVMLDANGTTVTQNAVAAVFAPGAVLDSQNRAADGSAPICGGNYITSNYLDGDAAIGAHNATPSTVANTISQFFTAGATTNINDQIIFITKSDIFTAIKKRNDFGAFISSLLNTATTCALPPVTVNFTNTPPTETSGVTIGNLKIGRIPKACLASPLNNWQDNLLYATCTSGSCLNINGISCDGVVIFSGERNASQNRTTSTDKNTWGNYLEDVPSANLTAFTTGGTSFSGASLYSTDSPSTDVLACIP